MAREDPQVVLDDGAFAAATTLMKEAVRRHGRGDERVMRRVVLPGRAESAWIDPDALAVVATYLMLRAVVHPDPVLAAAARDTGWGVFELLYPMHRHWIPRSFWPGVKPDGPAGPLDDIEDLILEGGSDALTQAVTRLDATIAGDAGRRDFLRGLALRDRAADPGRVPAARFADVDAATGILTACCAAPEPHPTWRARRRMALADAWEKRFVITGQGADLAAAESGYRQALAEAPEDTEAYVDAAAGLGLVLTRSRVVSPEMAPAVLAEASHWLRVAADWSYSPPARDAHRTLLAVVMRFRLEAMPHIRELPAAPAEPADPQPAGSAGDPQAWQQAEPVARMASLILARVMTEEEALRRVRDPSMALSPAAVTALLASPRNLVAGGLASRALPALVLAMAAARARWGAARDTVWWQAADLYVEAVRFVLLGSPDPALFGRACEVAEEQIAAVRQAGDTAELAATLFTTGLLRYNPFVSADTVRAKEPQTRAAVEQAVPYFEEAVRLATGHERGRYLKQLTEARNALAALRGEPSGPELLAGTREAFDLIDPVRDPISLITLLRVLVRYGEVMLPGDLDELLPVSLAAARDRDGLRQATALFGEALTLTQEADRADLGRQLLEAADRDIPAPPAASDRRLRWEKELHILRDNRMACQSGAFDARAVRGALRAQMISETWPAEARAATLAHLAAEMLGTGAEELGLDLLAETRELSPGLWERTGAALLYLRGQLTVNAAIDLEEAGHPDLAARRLADAVTDFADCLQTDLALGSLQDGLRCLQRIADDDARKVAAAAFILTAWSLRASTDETVAWRLRDLYQILPLMLISPAGVSHDTIFALHQAAKGVDFTIAQGQAGPLALSADLTAMLGRVSAGEARLPHPVAEPDAIPDDLAMLSYIGADEAETDADADTEQRNHQRAADRWISTELLAARQPEHIDLIAAAETLQALLPPETVLISLFLGEHQAGTGVRPPCLYGLAITREATEHHTLILGEERAAIFKLTRGEHAIFVHPVALELVSLRSAVVANPLHRVVSREAAPRLADEPDRPNPYLVGFTQALAGWREQGKTHLVIWPHGPFHYLPFHLLGAGGQPIGQDWTVTQVPSLGFLHARVHPPGRGLVVFGTATGSPRFGLHRADVQETHAAAVAAAMGTIAVIGPDATRRRLLAALAGARYAHIAAHGAHNEWAPWYQCLFLSPDGDDDGRVFAHDILQADLRGVELVTMSSCESALGRFDLNDNLRGLPAAFLAAGASAVIGCLWPVNPDAATAFFATLYARLAENPDRRAAFRAAQVATRDRYPAYRDWGAFCFIGDWRGIP